LAGNTNTTTHDHLTADEPERQYQSFPEQIGENSWDTLEKQWELINVCREHGEVVNVYPMRRDEEGGWIMRSHDATYTCPMDAREIGDLLGKIIYSNGVREC
jgi:hypothetical protein